MEWVETTGKTLVEAVDSALTALGVDESDLEYEVLQEPKSGLRGKLGMGSARIRARVKPISREKPNDRRRRRSREEKGERSEGSDRNRPRSGPKGDKNGKGKPRSNEGSSGAGNESAKDSGKESARDSNRAEGSGEAGRRNRRRGGAGRSSGGDRERTVEKSSVSVEDQAKIASEFLEGLVGSFGYSGSSSSVIENDDITVSIEGEGLGLLIGPQGVTLVAIEELSRAVLHRACGSGTARLHVDVTGYRAARREALAGFAAQVASRAVETGKEQALDPMNASDRKVVHDALVEFEGVETLSEGDDPRRYVVVRPS
ncbi:putative RNA-binding protein [Actinobacteria bacterium IMCC26256]|nr:putative RNA-binding protein [Actinobacteria bacterium IMCC26256]